jgi:hypothetical protein
MAEFSDWVDVVSIHLAACPRVVVIDAVRTVAIDFLERTRAWVYDCPVLTFDSTQAEYFLDLPSQAVLAHVWSARGRKYIKDQSTEPEYHIQYPDILILQDPAKVRLLDFSPVVSLKPKHDALSCPDFLLGDYRQAIASGAVAYLQMQPSQTWSQPNMAAPHQAFFEQAIVHAIQRRDQGFGLVRTANRVRPHFF